MAPWHLGESFESVDEQYEYWEALLNKIVDDHLPTRDMKVRADNVPYMTREWKNAMKAKRRFSKKFSTNPTRKNFELKRKWRNEATKERRKAIRQYWKKVSDNVKSDPIAPCKGIQNSLGFWIPCRGFRIPGTRFRISAQWIPDSQKSWIPFFSRF